MESPISRIRSGCLAVATSRTGLVVVVVPDRTVVEVVVGTVGTTKPPSEVRPSASFAPETGTSSRVHLERSDRGSSRSRAAVLRAPRGEMTVALCWSTVASITSHRRNAQVSTSPVRTQDASMTAAAPASRSLRRGEVVVGHVAPRTGSR